MPNNLSKFWQELKRRNVVRVITIYAGAAFVIIELINNIAEPLHLPEWTPTLVIVLLAIGFPIVIIFSWIYDIQPEEGMVKTEPADKIKAGDIPKSSNSWKIASYISFVVIVGLILLNVIPGSGNKEILDKSIAVLPFHNDSPNHEMYFINGVMEEILDNLCKIEDLRVVSRSSVEQYRNEPKPIPVVAEEMNVGYVLEGSGQRDGNKIRLTVQLLDAQNDKHIWSDSYYREISNIFSLQSEIAQLVAKEIEVVVTPEEKQRIESIPTRNMDAYDYYLLGQHYLYIGHLEDENLWKAIDYYQLAIDGDSTFAKAYVGLAMAYMSLSNFARLPANEIYPKATAFIHKAIDINEKSSLAHSVLGHIKYQLEYDFVGAEREFIRAIELNPNDLIAQTNYASHLSSMGRHDEALSQFDIAITLDPRPWNKFLRHYFLFSAGYKEEALKLAEEARDTFPDSPRHYYICASYYTFLGMYNEAISALQTAITLMSDDNISDEIGLLGYNYGRLGQKDKAHEQLDLLNNLSNEGIFIAPETFIWANLGLNNIDKAIEILVKSVDDRSINPDILRSLSYTQIQNDPRFIELRKKVGL